MTDILADFNLIDFLQEHGYPVKNHGRYLQIPAYWRDGQDQSSVVVYPADQIAKDFVTGESFDLKDLIKKVAGINEEEYVSKFGGEVQLVRKPYTPKISKDQFLDDSLLAAIEPEYDFYVQKGINKDLLAGLKSGVSRNIGKMKDRYVFPIFNNRNRLIGLAGRDITGQSSKKWKILGKKENFVYPAFFNLTELRQSDKVWIVESIGDFLALYQSGIKTAIVLFGTSMSLTVLNFLIRINPKKIVLGLNNDIEKNSAGNNAAISIESKLLRYFDRRKIEIQLPEKKDWFEQLIQSKL